jgi:hypothetical protein
VCDLVKPFQPKVTVGNEKAQAPIEDKDVQSASNRAKQIKFLEHQIKAAQVNVLDPKPRHSKHMTNDNIPVPVPRKQAISC